MTPRLTPIAWAKLVCVFEQLGYKVAGQKGKPHQVGKTWFGSTVDHPEIP